MFVCCSDEELEDYKALLYLPIAPEVEDPEENPFGPPPESTAQTGAPEETLAAGDKKQRQPSSEGPAKKKARTTTIELQGVPSDGERVKHNMNNKIQQQGQVYIKEVKVTKKHWNDRSINQRMIFF